MALSWTFLRRKKASKICQWKSHWHKYPTGCLSTYTYFFYKHGLFLAEPGKEIEIATSKLTTMCLKYWWFQPERAYKAVAFKKKKSVYQFVGLSRWIDLCFYFFSRTNQSNRVAGNKGKASFINCSFVGSFKQGYSYLCSK